MTPKKEQSLAERFKAGDRSHLILPLDAKLIELLPDDGTSVGGLYQIGSTAAELKKKLDGALTSPQISTRLRLMNEMGLVQSVRTLGATRGASWQKTSTGKEFAEAWLSQQ